MRLDEKGTESNTTSFVWIEKSEFEEKIISKISQKSCLYFFVWVLMDADIKVIQLQRWFTGSKELTSFNSWQ